VSFRTTLQHASMMHHGGSWSSQQPSSKAPMDARFWDPVLLGDLPGAPRLESPSSSHRRKTCGALGPSLMSLDLDHH